VYTIGIIAALMQEAAPLIRGLDEPRYTPIGPYPAHRGTVSGRPVTVVISGEGRKAAGGAEALIEAARPDLIISVGYAGGLIEGIGAGSVVVSNELVDDAGGREVFPTPGRFVPPAGGVWGVVLTSRRFIFAVDHRRELSDRFGAVAVDMESIHIGRIAREAGIGFLVVRVISDDLSAELPHMGSVMTEEGRLHIRRAIPYFLQHPGTIIPFIHFVGNLDAHADTLNRYLTEVIGSLPTAR
jgi:adenosylhomocysteine nucleosidase